MKLLFDANLSHKLVDRLEDVFPESTHVRATELKTQSDRAIWNFAKDRGLTIVTLDEDFFDLSCYCGPPPKVIWMRVGNQSTRVHEAMLREQIKTIFAFANDPSSGCLELI